MISVNISTIKQYFWYYNNFNNSNRSKIILPVLKMKEIKYIYHDKYNQLFDDTTLNRMNFVTYCKQYSYVFFEEVISDEYISSFFDQFICVFIKVDDNFKWSIEKNLMLEQNEFYNKMIKDDDMITFDFTIKRKSNVELINSQQKKEHITDKLKLNSNCKLQKTDSNDKLKTDSTNINQSNNESQIKFVDDLKHSSNEKLINNYIEDYVDTYSGIADPFWDDVVLVDYNPVYF